MKLVLAQINSHVGDIPGNTCKVIEMAELAVEKHQARVVVFPELVLTGYPPEDLLLRPSLYQRIDKALNSLCQANLDIYIVVGYPRVRDGLVFNAVGVFYQGQLIVEYHKQILPNYRVFDEKRYFEAGATPVCFNVDGCIFALSICEDIWFPKPVEQACLSGADVLLNISASPFHIDKQQQREAVLKERIKESAIPILYVNAVGGQDELVFDGGSVVIDGQSQLVYRAPSFEEGLYPVEIVRKTLENKVECIALQESSSLLDSVASVYAALVLGLREYVNKNGFPGVVLGLSGGIDSALTLAVAVDALGADRVEAVMMPFRYTSSMREEDARQQAKTQKVTFHSLPIEPMYEAFINSLEPVFGGLAADKTEENIQARCRGVLLMAISNKKGYMVVTTGNKSEVAVGYCTLYGDMVGGYSVLKDVPKTLVYKLAWHVNRDQEIIPVRVIERPPSAELAPDQKDEDSLPPYDILDRVLELYIEQDYSADDIIAQGFDEEMVHRVLRLVDMNEYKRRQSAVGVRITQKGFGRDRRYPIVSGWKTGD